MQVDRAARVRGCGRAQTVRVGVARRRRRLWPRDPCARVGHIVLHRPSHRAHAWAPPLAGHKKGGAGTADSSYRHAQVSICMASADVHHVLQKGKGVAEIAVNNVLLLVSQVPGMMSDKLSGSVSRLLDEWEAIALMKCLAVMKKEETKDAPEPMNRRRGGS